MSAENIYFDIEADGDVLLGLRFPDDPYNMNWIEGTVPWGTVKVPDAISISVKREYTPQNSLRETYCFTNKSNFPFFTQIGDIGIYTPFNDSYHEAKFCLHNRCHAHIWCGGTSSHVMALRMGGEAPHLGLVLTKGSLAHYSVERDISLLCNDRGDFIIHPSAMELLPGESAVVEWELFRHKGKEDFYRILRTYPSFVEFEADRWVYFEGENPSLTLKKRTGQEDVSLTEDSTTAPSRTGEKTYRAHGKGIDAWCHLLSLPPLWELAEKRCTYIVKNQQFKKTGHPLDGAYLIYDTKEGNLFYNHTHDHNGGRERVGMGVLIAYYLQTKKNTGLEESLKRYTAFVLRELFNEETGQVYNDIGRCTDYFRLYNYPWIAQFFIDLYLLWKNPVYLGYMYRAMAFFYKSGGDRFYALGMTAHEGYGLLKEAGLEQEAGSFLSSFLDHADTVLRNDTNYPAHEVKYEQSIVVAAVDILFQAYRLTGDVKYLTGAKKQTEVLSLFNGRQYDWSLYEAAIRHWDGYWFGKNKLYGDTFPHYWSALSGKAYWDYYNITGDKELLHVAEYSLRNVLGLFFPDGSASCARLYLSKSNGREGNFFDPFANDQDWGLYYNLKILPNIIDKHAI